MRKRLSKSVRKFIRSEKAKIRRRGLNLEEREKLVGVLYQGFLKTHEGARDLQPSNK